MKGSCSMSKYIRKHGRDQSAAPLPHGYNSGLPVKQPVRPLPSLALALTFGVWVRFAHGEVVVVQPVDQPAREGCHASGGRHVRAISSQTCVPCFTLSLSVSHLDEYSAYRRL